MSQSTLNSQLLTPNSPPPLPPRNPGAMKAKRLTPREQELPAMPPPTMPPIYVIVAWNRQRKRWMIADTTDHDFTGEARAKRLPPTHYMHTRIYKMS